MVAKFDGLEILAEGLFDILAEIICWFAELIVSVKNPKLFFFFILVTIIIGLVIYKYSR